MKPLFATFHVTAYDRYVFLYVGDPAGIKRIKNPRFNNAFAPKQEDLDRPNSDALCLGNGLGSSLIFARKAPSDATLVHECVHAAAFLHEDLGVKESSPFEGLCYLAENIFAALQPALAKRRAAEARAKKKKKKGNPK